MLLKELTELNGVSGDEKNVRSFIKNSAKKYADEVNVDKMGNLIVFKKGRKSKHKIMLTAHMDEVGFIVSGYTESGLIKFKTIGGIDERILPGKRVVIGSNKISGVIGLGSFLPGDDSSQKSPVKIKDLHIDIGIGKKDEAKEIVSLGDYISFNSDFSEIGDGCIKAKALDDRAGCALLIEILKNRYNFDLYACFTVQEEVGLRGAKAIAYTVKPDIALIIEATTCSDVKGVDKHSYSTIFGGGAVLTIVDKTSYPDKQLNNYIYNCAHNNKIKVQYKQTVSGGNDAGEIQLFEGGVKVAVISVPCRYIHSPVSLMKNDDFISCKKLVLAVMEELSNKTEDIEWLKKGGA